MLYGVFICLCYVRNPNLCCVGLVDNPSCLAMLLACNIRVRYDQVRVMLCLLACYNRVRYGQVRVMLNEHLCCVYAIKAGVVRVRGNLGSWVIM